MAANSSLTFRADKNAVQRLDQLAQATDRSKSWHMEQALEQYLALQSWQIAHIQQGLDDLAAGRLVSHHEIAEELSSWGKEIDG